MKRVGITAGLRDLAERKAARPDQLQRVLELEAPNEVTWAFAACFLAETAQAARRKADAAREFLAGAKLGEMGGGDRDGAFNGGMDRRGKMAPVPGRGVGGKPEQAGARQRRHRLVKKGVALSGLGEAFVDEQMNHRRRIVDRGRNPAKLEAIRGRQCPGGNLAPGVDGRFGGRETEEFTRAGEKKDGLTGNEFVDHVVNRDAQMAAGQHDQLEDRLDAGTVPAVSPIRGAAEEIILMVAHAS